MNTIKKVYIIQESESNFPSDTGSILSTHTHTHTHTHTEFLKVVYHNNNWKWVAYKFFFNELFGEEVLSVLIKNAVNFYLKIMDFC
jgi:hypothetical protein